MFDSSPNSWIPDMVDFFTPREKSNNSFSKKVFKEKGKSKPSVENISSNFNNDNENSITTISNSTGSKNKRKRDLSTGKSDESFNVQKKRRKLQSGDMTSTPFGSEGRSKKKRKSKNNDFSSQSIEQEIVNESFKNEETVSFESPKKKNKKKNKSLENISITSRNIKQEIKNGSVGEEGNKSTHSVEKKKMKKEKTKISNVVINESNSRESEEQDDDSDDDSTGTKKSKKKLAKKITRQGSMQPDDAQKSRTVFFGNLPNTWTKDRFLKKISKRYGKLEMSTFKFKPVKQKDSENKAVENKPEILYAVVRFVNKSSAVKAVNDNGIVFSDHHIRINMAHEDIVQDRNKSVFVGNVPRTTNEDELWQLFESCGKIRSIRILRDAYTGNSKNVAYVNFESTDSVELALKLDGETLKERELRVQRCMTRERKRKEKRRNKKLRTSTESTLQQKKKKSPDSMTTFQGETSSKKQKKKKKLNKEEIRKRILMKKLAPTMKQAHKMKLKSV